MQGRSTTTTRPSQHGSTKSRGSFGAAALPGAFSADMEETRLVKPASATALFSGSQQRNISSPNNPSLTSSEEDGFGCNADGGPQLLPRIAAGKNSIIRAAASRPLSTDDWLPRFPDDQFSVMEKTVAQELNFCRCTPVVYAQSFRSQYVMSGPFLINKPSTETRRHLERLTNRLQVFDEEFEAQRQHQETAWASRHEELQTAIASVTKKAKGAKKPAPKKDPKDGTKAGIVQEEPPEEALEREQQQFNALESQLQEEYLQARAVAEEEIGHVQTALDRVEACAQYLAAQSPLPWLEYCRGLSLAGRAHHLMRKATTHERVGPITSIEERASHYGTAIGGLEELSYRGVDTAQQIVASLILQEFERLSPLRPPNALTVLQQRFAHVGVGWGQPIGDSKGGLCVIALAERFMESRAIRERHHLPLQAVLRELELCRGPRHHTTQIIFKHLPHIGHVRPQQPLEHPISLSGRSATMTLRVPEDVVVLASFDGALPHPATPAMALDDRVFVQHQGTEATIHLTLTQPGNYRLVCFVKKIGALRYEEIGYIDIRSSFNDCDPSYSGLPTAYAAFGDLRCFLNSPMQNPLQADAGCSFQVFINVNKEEEVAHQMKLIEEAHREEMSKVALLHSSALLGIQRERQEVEMELARWNTPESLNSQGRVMTAPDKKGKRGVEKPKTPQAGAASTKRLASKKWVDLQELESRVATERVEKETAGLRQKLLELDDKQAQAIEELEHQQRWMQEKRDRAKGDLERRRTQPMEVVVLNNDHRHLLSERPYAAHWFDATEVKLREGTATLVVDGRFVLRWRVERLT